MSYSFFAFDIVIGFYPLHYEEIKAVQKLFVCTEMKCVLLNSVTLVTLLTLILYKKKIEAVIFFH